jgi:hypothetical protein|tara:strand:+ start:1955 stop:3793 length:1839 start_codon:yes stop_codon:yes gene_type:complete
MAYQINKTSGALLVNLADGQVDVASTDITLIGKNYTGFGEAINENFVSMLENFANTSAPTTPLAGQIWWDTSSSRLKVYTGANWTTGGGPLVGSTQPPMVAGDLWINNEQNQLYFFDGTDLGLAGPIYNAFQGQSGPEVITVLDNTGTSRTIVKYWVGGTFVGLWSKIEFTPQSIDTIPGYTGTVVKGFNVVDADFVFAGTATRTTALVDSNNVSRTAAQFLASDSDDATSGALTVRNNNGVTVGLTDNNVLKVEASGVISENQVSGENYTFRMTTSTGKVDAMTIDSANSRIGVFNTAPAYTFDVNGSLRVSGDLIIGGEQLVVDVGKLLVRDKSIELAKGDDSTLLDDAGVDEAGIIVASSGGNKSWLWRNSTSAWTSNQSINIETGSLKFGGVDIITGSNASGITQLGALTSASIGNISFTGGIGMSTGAVDGDGNGLNITAAGNINLVTARQIKNVTDPTANQDVATKAYVDASINIEALSIALDVTGIGSAGTTQQHTNIGTILEDIAPAGTKQNGSEARVHCTTTTGATATLTGSALDTAFNESTVLVQQKDNGGADDGSVSVIQSATFNNATGNITSTVTRSLKLFRVVTGSWAYVQDISQGTLI